MSWSGRWHLEPTLLPLRRVRGDVSVLDRLIEESAEHGDAAVDRVRAEALRHEPLAALLLGRVVPALPFAELRSLVLIYKLGRDGVERVVGEERKQVAGKEPEPVLPSPFPYFVLVSLEPRTRELVERRYAGWGFERLP